MTTKWNGVLRHLRTAALIQDADALGDDQLLERFLTHQDEQAFEALVRRHGAMVWGVCRRALRTVQDAEDAFQATFLVLLRKAASIQRRELVGNWLYGAACRAALQVKAAARRAQHVPLSDLPERAAVPEGDVWRELRGLLDRELSRLPDKYRVAVVLCDLQGQTRQEAARQLGLPEGTLSGQVDDGPTAAGRKRLGRYGLTLSGAALAMALAQSSASAVVPSALVTGTMETVTAVAAGQTPLGETRVTVLTEGVLKAMLLSKIKRALAVVVALAALLVGIGSLVLPALEAEQPRPAPAAAPQAKQQPPKLPDAGNVAANGPQAKEEPVQKGPAEQHAATGGIDPAVVAKWEKAGEKFGWIYPDDFGRMVFAKDRPADPAALPCFSVAAWPEGGITTLPPPAAPFALLLNADAPKKGGKGGGFGKNTEPLLQRLAGLKHLRVVVLTSQDANMETLGGLHQLQVLHLTSYSEFGPAEYKNLAGLQHLESLALNYCRFNGDPRLAAFPKLTTLPKLATLHLAHTRIEDEDLKELAELKKLQILDLSSTNVSDAGLKHLAQLPQWRALSLSGTKVSDAGMKELAGFAQLQALDLSKTKVADAGLKELAGLGQLRTLYLADTDVTDAGLKELAGLKQLRTLDLSRTWVTDAGLKTLANLKQLREVRVRSTQVTDAGAAELRKALPEVVVER